MGQFLRYCFSSEREAFLADLRPKYILPSLIDDGIVTQAENEEVLKAKKSKHQVLRLIDVLSKKGPEVFDSFVKALQKDGSYPWLADKLLETKKSGNYKSEIQVAENLHKHLVAGCVPFQTNHFFKRERIMCDIRKALRLAVEKKRHWVVLHGMMGCGKSVLAAEAIRNNEIFKECFSSGVCWITVGNVKTNVSLKLKMQILWEHLEGSQAMHFEDQETIDTSIDAIMKVRQKFREALAREENQKFLIILDDVWKSEVIDAFDIHCPVIVTAKDKSVVDKVSSFCTFIDVGGDQYKLSPADTMQFLAPYVKVLPSDLPANEIYLIHSKCKGLPLMLGLIGSLMSRWGNKLERWKNLRENLEKGFTKVGSRNQNVSEDISSIHSMIEHLIDSLDAELKEYYYDLAVFEADVFIRTKVLEVMWGINKIEVEDIMCELKQKSLVLFEEDPNSESYKYSVHDLYLNFLKGNCQDMEERHRRLVKNYLDLCKVNGETFNYGLFPDDGYIHYFIGLHLKEAGLEEYFPEIFLDFNFIQNKLHFSGPSDLLYDLECYKLYFEEKISEVKDIDAFIRRNAHLISQKDADIIQLALFEQQSSTVYINAKEAALAKTGKLYFEWRNQENVKCRSLLNVKLCFQSLNCVTFSPDNDVVAAVGNDNCVLIWDCASGKELDKLNGHTGVINCCVFDKSGKILASASEDKTVRLWEMNYGLLSARRSSKTKRLSEPNFTQLDFSQSLHFNSEFSMHKSGVLCCAFSPDGNLVMSGDSTGIAYVWEVESGFMKYKVECVSELVNRYPVTCCSFATSNKVAASSGSEIFVKNLNSGKQNSLYHDEVVTAFCFTSDGLYLYSACTYSIWKWDLGGFNKPTKLEVFRKAQSSICCCCLSPNEKFIAAGTSDCSVIVLNIISQKPVINLKDHKDFISSLSYSSDGNKLLSASQDGHVIIWNMPESNATSMLSLKGNLSVQWHGDMTIALSDESNCIQVRSGLSGELKCKSTPDTAEITACLLSDDCSIVVYGTKNGAINIFDNNSGKTTMCEPHRSKINFLIQMNNPQNFISCSEDSTMRVWNSDKKFTTFKGHLKSVLMCVLYGGDKMLSCSEDGTLRVWNTVSAKQIMVLEGHGNQNVTYCDVSPCEKYLCSSSTDKTIKVWDAANGRELKYFCCKDCVRCCRFSPIQGYLLSGEDSGLITLWNIFDKENGGKPLGSHDSWVTDIQFSADGSQFVTVSDSIKFWTKDGCLAQTVILSGAFPCVLKASPDFKLFVLVHNSVLYILKSII